MSSIDQVNLGSIGVFNRLSYDHESGCWNYTGPVDKQGRSYVKFHKRRVAVYRLAAHLWMRFDLNSELSVLHRCDNPRCFNPKHLIIGTQHDNILDMVQKGR